MNVDLWVCMCMAEQGYCVVCSQSVISPCTIPSAIGWPRQESLSRYLLVLGLTPVQLPFGGLLGLISYPGTESSSLGNPTG